MENSNIHYFLGTNTPIGFAGFFDELRGDKEDMRLYVLKGGPGTGKSTLMKRVAEGLREKDIGVEYIHCSSDPDSLDGIVVRDKGIAVADGTAPHVIEPLFPGAADVLVDLGEGWCADELRKNRTEIIRTVKENTHAHKTCRGFLKAAAELICDSKGIQRECIISQKLSDYIAGIGKRYFRKKKGSSKGSEKKIFLSAFTPDGAIFFGETVRSLAEDIIEVDDAVGEVSRQLMGEIRRIARAAGYDIITAFCPMFPTDAEHIVIPELSLAFVRRHEGCRIDGCRRIHWGRFADKKAMKEHRQRIRLNARVSRELTERAVKELERAKEIHDKLEGYYIPHMDFSRVREQELRILRETVC